MNQIKIAGRNRIFRLYEFSENLLKFNLIWKLISTYLLMGSWENSMFLDGLPRELWQLRIFYLLPRTGSWLLQLVCTIVCVIYHIVVSNYNLLV